MKTNYFPPKSSAFQLSLLLLLALLPGCKKDLGNYDYRTTNKVSFNDPPQSGYSFITGQEGVLAAPIQLTESLQDTAATFDIGWYLGSERIFTGPVLHYTFEQPGQFKLYLKVINKETQETYLSSAYDLQVISNFEWGWLILSDRGDTSSLSIIDPDLRCSHRIYEPSNNNQILGSGPLGIFYYYVYESIEGFYVGGDAKILINQRSGNLTLDASRLLPDMWLRDEFTGGKEPENLKIDKFFFKELYYGILDSLGEIYLRRVDRENSKIPYYGKYTALPEDFDGQGTHIACLQNFDFFNKNLRSCIDFTILYDDKNARFIGLFEPTSTLTSPAITYFHNYDQELVVPGDVLKVNEMGQGTRVLGITTWEGMDLDYSWGDIPGVTPYSTIYSLIDKGGTGEYYIHDWTLKNYKESNHLITDTHQLLFSGSSILTEKSIIRLSPNFEDNPYSYFTDGNGSLYIHDIRNNAYTLAYETDQPIKDIYASPVVSTFKNYGGNPDYPNWRLALVLEDNTVEVIDVSKANSQQLFLGLKPDLHLATFDGFGEIKGMIWATRGFSGEY